MLAVPDAQAAASWYERSLGAVRLWDLGGVVGLRVEDAPFFLHEPVNPEFSTPAVLGVTTVRVEVFTADPDSFIERAVAAGAVGTPIDDHQRPWGVHRQGGFHDPFGHVWIVGDRSPLGAEHGERKVRTMPDASVIPQLGYPDVPAAIEWLCAVFGFTERWRVGVHRAQLDFGNGTVVVHERRHQPGGAESAPAGHSLLVRVRDVDAHHQRARQRGARILAEPADYQYGERQYTAEDIGGHRWTFSQTVADLAPEDWGGRSAARDS